MTSARKITGQEVRQRYVVCECGKFAHIIRASVLRLLPDGYSGERCPECNLWMCAVDKLPKREEDDHAV